MSAATAAGSCDADDLLVFGYACKVYRDDARALQTEKALIPWMGDASITIDRYDGRGHLSSLAEFEPRAGIWEQHWSSLGPDEATEEQLTEEERWLSLNDQNEETRDEILKRAAATGENFAEIGFNYDSQDSQLGGEHLQGSSRDDTAGVENRPDDFVDPDDKPYKVPKGLILPVTVQRPETRREHTIIEKTAQFIARQGGQLEVIIRVKQKNNAQFAFLDIEHPLNLYYRYLVQQIKSGAYRPASSQNERDSDSESDSDSEGGYLHPSLFASKNSTAKTSSGPPEALKNIFRAQISNKATCAYSQLIDMIRPSLEQDNQQEASSGPASVENVGSVESASGTDSNHASTADTTADSPSNGKTAGKAATKSGSAISAQDDAQSTAADSQTLYPAAVSSDQQAVEGSTVVAAAAVELEELVAVMPPPPDVQPIVDKMAEYVAKNGPDFEESIRAKGDPKFSFVDPGDEFYEYYQFKVNEFSNRINGNAKEAASEDSDVKTSGRPSTPSEAVRGTPERTKSPNALERIAIENSVNTSPERTPTVEKKKVKISLKCQENGEKKSTDKSSGTTGNAATSSNGGAMIGPLLPSLYDDEDVEVQDDVLEELLKAERGGTASTEAVPSDGPAADGDKKADRRTESSKSRRRSESGERRKYADGRSKEKERSRKRDRSRSGDRSRRSSREKKREDRERDRDKIRRRNKDRSPSVSGNAAESSHGKTAKNGSSHSEKGVDDMDEVKRKQLERRQKLAAFLSMVKGQNGTQTDDKGVKASAPTDLKAKIRHLKKTMAASDEELALGEADSRRPPDEQEVRVPMIKVSKHTSSREEAKPVKIDLKKLWKETLEEGELVDSKGHDSCDDSYERRRRHRSRERERRRSSSSRSRSSVASERERSSSRNRRRHHKHHKSKSSRRYRD